MEGADLATTGLTSLAAVFAAGPPAATCVREAVLTESFGVDTEDRCSVDAVFFAVAGGLLLFVVTAAAVAYERRGAAGTMARDEQAGVRKPSWA